MNRITERISRFTYLLGRDFVEVIIGNFDLRYVPVFIYSNITRAGRSKYKSIMYKVK